MAEPSTDMNYTFDDIHRYLQGKMSAAEMHTMEKAALQDPFLADALEGYSEVSAATAAKHLNEINAALTDEHKNSKVVLFSRKQQWMRIAALVIIFAALGVAGVYVFNKSNSRQEVAQVKNEKSDKETVPIVTDSDKNKTAVEALKTNDSVEAKKQELPGLKSKSTAEKAVNGITSNGIKQNQSVARTNMAAPSPIAKEQVQPDEEANNSQAESLVNKEADSLQNLGGIARGVNISSPVISGKVIDVNGRPIPDVIVQSADKKETTLTNSNGDFSLHKHDSLADILASAVGFQNQNARLRAGGENLIVLYPSNGSLNEVVVTALGAKKSDSAINKGARPAGGWRNFNNYVQKRLNEDTAVTYDNYSDGDLVELEFSIDKAGNPVDIKFLQSLDTQHNMQAVDIIRRGPKWIGSKNKKVRVHISF